MYVFGANTNFRKPVILVYTSIYSSDSNGTFVHLTTLAAEGNVLDIAICAESDSFFYTMDNVHDPATTDILVPEQTHKPYLGCYRYSDRTSSWISQGDEGSVGCVEAITRFAIVKQDSSSLRNDSDSLTNLLYVIEHLRKRPTEEIE